MKRIIEVEIEIDDNDTKKCGIDCRFCIGLYCDAFIKNVTTSRVRCIECLKAEGVNG